MLDFYEVVGQVLELLQRQGRVSYRALKRQFDVDDDYIADLKAELISAQQIARDEDNRILVWVGKAEGSVSAPTPTSQQPIREVYERHPTATGQLEAERRQLTVMFCDVVDSTNLSSQLDPEDYLAVLHAYQATCAEVIQRFDGWIAQHLGDALLVYFGFPSAHEHATQHAVLAGLGMLEAMQTLNTRLEQEKGFRLAIRVGIHTGLTVVGDIGEEWKHAQLAMGETPNIAARIQSITAPDTIAISEATARLVHGYFACDDLGFHSLKGVAEPQRLYRVICESGAHGRLDVAATRGFTPLVGRESEVTLLLEYWEQVKDGHGQVVLLSGEAGIGKSRLVQVVKEHVANEPHTRVECRSSPYYQNTALFPVLDMWRRGVGLRRDDAPAMKLEKLERTLSRYRFSLEDTVPLFASLLSLPLPEGRYPPLTLSPHLQRRKSLETILAIWLERAEQQPVLLIMEDLQWIDPSTLELLALLIDQGPTARIFTLLTCRPEFQPPWGNRAHVTSVTLTRLRRHQAEGMVTRIAGGKSVPAEVLQQIVTKTDGVPLFIEELTKTILESGLLREADDHYTLTGRLPAMAIPSTLQDSLLARLDRLATAKGVAQLGATIGRQFTFELLQAVSLLDEATLRRELTKLVEVELLYQRGLGPHATYVFKHALIQDAAYQSLLKSTRQRYHQRIAQVLEAKFPEIAETRPELLAYHYTEAGHNEQAVDSWHRAGQRAIEHSANVEAVSHLTKGLQVLTTLPDTRARARHELVVYTTLGPALMATRGAGAPEVERTYTRARELCQQVGDTPQHFSALRGLWRFYLNRAVFQTAQELGEQLLTLAQSQHDPVLLLTAHTLLGQTLCLMGDITLARTHLEQGMAFSDPEQQHTLAVRYGTAPAVQCLTWLAHTLWALGYPQQALRKSHEAYTLAQELAHPLSLAYTLYQTARLHQYLGDEHVTHERAEALIILATEQGFVQWMTAGTFLRGWVLAAQGRWEEGLEHMRQGSAAALAKGSASWRPYFLASLGEVYRRIGQVEEGLAKLTEALALVDETRERFYEAELHRLTGSLLYKRSPDDHTDAEVALQKACSVARSQGAKAWEIRAATALARLWQQQGKGKEARELLAPVYEWFTEGFDTLDLQAAKALLDALEH